MGLSDFFMLLFFKMEVKEKQDKVNGTASIETCYVVNIIVRGEENSAVYCTLEDT